MALGASLRAAVAVLSLATSGVASSVPEPEPDAPAARVGQTIITVAEVDQRCGDKCARLLASLADERRRTLDLLVDEALLAAAPQPTPTVEPVSTDEIERYRSAHAAELSGDEPRDTAAVRFLLERERRETRDRALIAVARGRTPPSIDPAANSATVGRTRIGPRDVEQRAALALYRLRGELARERLRQVDTAVGEQLWTIAAQARGTTAEQLRAQAAARAPAVTGTDIQRYFDEEVKPRDPRAVVNPERIRPYLEFRARKAQEDAVLAEIRGATPVAVLLAEPEPPLFALGSLPGALSGISEAPVRLVYLTSFRGAASRRLWETLRAYAADGTPDVSLAVRPLLPQWDPEAAAIAAGVACAAEQGRWWPVLDTLSRADPLPDARGIFRIARAAGLDEPRFAHCVSRPETPDAIARHSREAEHLGLTEPPIVLVNGLALGAPSPERLAQAVAAARVAAGGRPGPPVSAPSSPASASP